MRPRPYLESCVCNCCTWHSTTFLCVHIYVQPSYHCSGNRGVCIHFNFLSFVCFLHHYPKGEKKFPPLAELTVVHCNSTLSGYHLKCATSAVPTAENSVCLCVRSFLMSVNSFCQVAGFSPGQFRCSLFLNRALWIPRVHVAD